MKHLRRVGTGILLCFLLLISIFAPFLVADYLFESMNMEQTQGIRQTVLMVWGLNLLVFSYLLGRAVE